MKPALACIVMSTGLMTASTAFALTPAAAPAGSTGLCKDGSYTSTPDKQGACRGHKGVQDWFGAAAAPTPAAPAKAAAKDAPKAPKAAAGGAPGQVWVNGESKTYHCPGSKHYGKTKQGEYMSESAAKAAGHHANHGKACV